MGCIVLGKIKIIKSGLLTTVQDKGRYGYQQFGVPVSGVMDSFSHRVSNLLVGNNTFESVLEATLLGPTIEFENDSVIAITGADLLPKVNGKEICMWKSIYIKKGDILSFNSIKSGCRSYISFAGGIDVPLVMGSKSTYIKGNIGGYEGRALISGDVLKIGNPKDDLKNLKGRTIHNKYKPVYTDKINIRVILGPQDKYFTSEGIQSFLSKEYIVTNECDRMGYRLDGIPIQHINGADIISDGIAFGAIQVPDNGKPIIMMADRQTIGGYTKIANIISYDLSKIAQAKPGDKIRFESITIKESHTILKESFY